MTTEPASLINRLFHFNLWANVLMIDLYADLAAGALRAQNGDVFAQIWPLLIHTIRAEGNYVRWVTGSLPWSDAPDWDGMTPADLRARAQVAGQKLIDIAEAADPMTPHTSDNDGAAYRFHNWTVLVQAIYHGIEHRTQIKALLTDLGVPHPEFSSWHYMETLQ